MPLLLLSASLVLASFGYGKTVTLGLSDPSLSFPTGWQTSQSASGEPFLSTTSLGEVLRVTIPDFATSLQYRGYKQSQGSVYGVCLDCNTSMLLSFADGHDPSLTNDTDAKLSTLFTMDLNPLTVHEFTLFNFPDSQFNATSELTFHSLVVDLEADDDDSDDAPFGDDANLVPNVTISATFPTLAYTTITTTITASPFSLSSVSGSSIRVYHSLVAIIAAGVIVAVLTIALVVYFLLHKRRTYRQRRQVSSEFFNDRPQESKIFSPTFFTRLESTISQPKIPPRARAKRTILPVIRRIGEGQGPSRANGWYKRL
ncbi:hypothetical protein BDN72DRAFT_890697 [Pluteus cervinus]|uniref:Uncharacterized protein n=1 Tax=Pluteus cervinus TaxID=181527 RepID=A0ACD3BGW3_9AGAR|nr:hypothetical protein BDN72DRAFT_890697 [Pluteus cervinus]